MKKVLLVFFCIFMLVLSGREMMDTTAVVAATATSVDAPTAAPTPDPTPTATPEPPPTTTPIPTPTPIPDPTRITVMAVGDLLCLNAQLRSARHDGAYDFEYVFEGVAETISSADLAIGNLETLVAEGYPLTNPLPEKEVTVNPSDGSPPYTTTVRGGITRINAPESFVDAVLGAGFDVLTNANNHMYDRGTDGIEKTMQVLQDHSVFHTGAYAAEEDKRPMIVQIDGVRIAVCAYTSVLNHRPGSDNAFMIDTYSEEKVAADLAAAEEANADYTIVCVHWGNENTHRENRSQRSMAAFIANAGADIILGSHPHATQPFEMIETEHGNVPVIYSMGNFISSMPRTMNKDGVILRLVLEKEYVTGTTSLAEFSYIPTLCTSTDGGSYAVVTADLESIAQSDNPSRLESSRERTIDVLGNTIATPE